MRKMFSEKQIKGLAVNGVNEAIEGGQVQVGTKLYEHYLIFNENEDIWVHFVSNLPKIFEENDSIEQKILKITEVVSTSLFPAYEYNAADQDETGLVLATPEYTANSLKYLIISSADGDVLEDLVENITSIDDEVTPL